MHKTREMLNMLNMLNAWGKIWAQNGPFSRPTFNIFNISRVLSIFRKKYLTFPQFRDPRFTKNVEMLNVFVEMCLKQGEC